MKKLILFFVGAAIAVTACGPHVEAKIEYGIITDYIYVNKSSSEITVHAFLSDYYGSDSLFVIPVEGSYTLRNPQDARTKPLNWRGDTSDEDYTTISNGEKTVTQTRANKNDRNRNNLYYPDNYITLSYSMIEYPSHLMLTTVLYVFTDDFFETGEPIEQ